MESFIYFSGENNFQSNSSRHYYIKNVSKKVSPWEYEETTHQSPSQQVEREVLFLIDIYAFTNLF